MELKYKTLYLSTLRLIQFQCSLVLGWWCCCILTLLLTFILYFKDNLNDVTFALLFDRWLLQIQVQNKWDLFSIDCFISSRTVKAAACSILCWPGLLKAALENELYFEGCYNCGSIKKLLLFALIVASTCVWNWRHLADHDTQVSCLKAQLPSWLY